MRDLKIVFFIVSIYLIISIGDSWKYFGVPPIPVLFWDLHVVLAAIDGYHAGYDVYKSNPFAAYNIPHCYPNTWFLLKYFGFSMNNLIPISIFLLSIFIYINLKLFKSINSNKKHLVYILLLSSPPFVLAFERLNNDFIVFILIYFSIITRSIYISNILITLSYLLKIYPFVCIINNFLSHEKIKKKIIISIIQIIVFTVFLKYTLKILPLSSLPEPGYNYSFGINNFADLISNFMGLDFYLVKYSIIFISFGIILFHLRDYIISTILNFNQVKLDKESKLFVTGCSLLTSCYFLTNNFDHRLLFILFCLPLILNQNFNNFKFIIFGFLFYFSCWNEGFKVFFNLLSFYNFLSIEKYVSNLHFIVSLYELIFNHIFFCYLLYYMLKIICKCSPINNISLNSKSDLIH